MRIFVFNLISELDHRIQPFLNFHLKVVFVIETDKQISHKQKKEYNPVSLEVNKTAADAKKFKFANVFYLTCAWILRTLQGRSLIG